MRLKNTVSTTPSTPRAAPTSFRPLVLSCCVTNAVMRKTKIGEVELRTLARPDSTYCCPQTSGSVEFSEAQKRLGLTRSQLDTPIKAEILEPGEGGDQARPRFTEATVQYWLDYVASFPLSERWETLTGIGDAARKHGISTSAVMALILNGTLKKVYCRKDASGFSAILIDKLEINALLKAG